MCSSSKERCYFVCRVLCGFSLKIAVAVDRTMMTTTTATNTRDTPHIRCRASIPHFNGFPHGAAINVYWGASSACSVCTESPFTTIRRCYCRRIIIHAIHAEHRSPTAHGTPNTTQHARNANPYKCTQSDTRCTRRYHNTHKYYVSLMWYFTDYESACVCTCTKLCAHECNNTADMTTGTIVSD